MCYENTVTNLLHLPMFFYKAHITQEDTAVNNKDGIVFIECPK